MKISRLVKARCVFLVLLALVAAAPALARAQDSDPAEHGRKVSRRVTPTYPGLARPMRLTGTVRLVAVVAPNGTVRLTQPVGGNPVLLKAAEDAVRKWKFVPAAGESQEIIELHFSPE